jgi:hypothetical protein
MAFDTPDRLFEYGVEADYFEIWERLPGSAGEDHATGLPQEPGTFLLVAGDFFMTVRPRTGTLPPAKNLLELACSANPAQLRDMLDFEISFGRRAATAGRIELSTLPWREGTEIRFPVASQ